MRRFLILPLALLLMAFVSASFLPAQDEPPKTRAEEEKAGVEMDEVTELTATIEAIDHANRTVTLRGSGGRTATISVPEDFDDFDTLRVGDKVKARYAEAIAVNFSEPGQPLEATEVEQASNVPGGKAAARKVNVRVQVKSIDQEEGTLTVMTPEGKDVTMHVDDTARLNRLKPGDQINVTYTEALLVTLEKAQGAERND